jgi:hypothetical protein
MAIPVLPLPAVFEVERQRRPALIVPEAVVDLLTMELHFDLP